VGNDHISGFEVVVSNWPALFFEKETWIWRTETLPTGTLQVPLLDG
jgi:hypothetical protein